MKRFMTTLITMGAISFCSLFSAQAYAATGSQSNAGISSASTVVQFPDAKPFIDQQNRTQVPLRFLSQSLGYNVHWQGNDGQVEVTLQDADKQIVLQTNDAVAYIDGQTRPLDSAPTLKDNRTYVPLRFVTEAFGSNVQWDGQQSAAIVTSGSKRLLIPVPQTPVVQLTQANSSSQPDAQAQPAWCTSLISSAKQWMGVPYVFGGTSTSGFDCSGFVQYVFAQNGVSLPRTAAEMYQMGTPVSNLQPGDLVFFTTYAPGASHVGIYVGNNQFISATTSHGVSISSLDNPYWGPRYLGAKRL